jgi:hypothetical protein
MKKVLWSLFLLSFILIGCQEEIPVQTENSEGVTLNKWGMPKEVQAQLLAAKAATAKYNDINRAIADGYVDINVVIPNMGHHYAKMSLMDDQFEVTKPEILVYEEMHNGKFRLVALEYAVPLNLSVNAPEGFIGDYDVWFENTGAGIWALHAWIWKDNPDGVFAAYNPNVP